MRRPSPTRSERNRCTLRRPRGGSTKVETSTARALVRILTKPPIPAPTSASLEPLYAAEAEKRKQAIQFGNTATQKSAEPISKGETRDKVPQNYAEVDTREKLADIAGVSHETLRKVKATLTVS